MWLEVLLGHFPLFVLDDNHYRPATPEDIEGKDWRRQYYQRALQSSEQLRVYIETPLKANVEKLQTCYRQNSVMMLLLDVIKRMTVF